MSKFTQQFNTSGVLEFAGELDYNAITPELWEQSKQLIAAAPAGLQIDLGAITHSDSTGVGFIVALVKLARKENKKISFLNLPEQMRAIIRVSGLEKLLI